MVRFAEQHPLFGVALREYGLLADFLDGMLEACTEQTVLVDAYEFSYPYKQPEQFRRGYETITKDSLAWTAEPEFPRSTGRIGPDECPRVNVLSGGVSKRGGSTIRNRSRSTSRIRSLTRGCKSESWANEIAGK